MTASNMGQMQQVYWMVEINRPGGVVQGLQPTS